MIHVVAAVIIREGSVFVTRRGPHKNMPGKWEFPGGKVESTELPENALVREIKEELGIAITVVSPFDRSVTRVDDSLIDLETYFCELANDEPKSSSDHDQMMWIKIRNLCQLEFAMPDLPAVHKLINSLEDADD